MQGISCDRCGVSLLIEESVRYILKIELSAAYDPLELTRDDLLQDFDGEYRSILRQISASSAEALGEQVHAVRSYDLCGRCHTSYLQDPFGERS